MKVLAFDQSTTNTGWAFGATDQNSHYDFGSIKAPKREHFPEKLAFIFTSIRLLVDRYEPDLIAHEMAFMPVDRGQYGKGGHKPSFLPEAEPVMANGARFNVETVKQLQKIEGVVMTIAGLYGLPNEAYASSSWRKTLLGFGRAPKGSDEQWMKRQVKARIQALGYDVTSNDESDALGVLYHALHGPEAAKRAQGDLLSMVAGGL